MATHHEGRLRAVELERARTAGTVAIVAALADGGQVVEADPDGRSRLVSLPERRLGHGERGMMVERHRPTRTDDPPNRIG